MNKEQLKAKEEHSLISPFKIKPPKKITKKHLGLLEEWDSTWNTIRNSVWDSIWDSAVDLVGDTIWGVVKDSIWDSVGDSVGKLIEESIKKEPIKDSVWESIRDSVGAYIGYIFSPVIKEWKYFNHTPGEYPFQSVVDLWKMGLAPSFDGEKWRLHGGEKAEVLWEGEL